MNQKHAATTTTTKKKAAAARRSARRAELALALRVSRLRLLSRVAPAEAARRAFALWVTPNRLPWPERELAVREAAAVSRVPHAGREGRIELAVYRWGAERADAPLVLLVHGWEGRATQLGALVGPLVAAGYGVVALDLPGHGASGGVTTDLPDMAAAVRAVGDGVLPEGAAFRAIVAHSLGGPAALLAVGAGLAAERVVTIGSPTKMTIARDTFLGRLKLATRAADGVISAIEARLGDDCWERYRAETTAAALEVPGLVVHDSEDGEVTHGHALELAVAWRGARVLLTRGLGHRRILRDPGVVDAVSRFIDAPLEGLTRGEKPWYASWSATSSTASSAG
ncbi:MAG: alpha/beta fold hydrolase [Myxococcales bacterium]|nr:alpha/beta fold hydrolase [Myxococcales bacterium]